MMTMSLRRELYKLRELISFTLAGAGATERTVNGPLTCWFCKKPLDTNLFVRPGEAPGPRFTAKLSIHHVNGDHDDQRMENKALCHTKCHKSYHRSKSNAARAAMEEVEK